MSALLSVPEHPELAPNVSFLIALPPGSVTENAPQVRTGRHDLLSGWGATMTAAHGTHRRSAAIELDPVYGDGRIIDIKLADGDRIACATIIVGSTRPSRHWRRQVRRAPIGIPVGEYAGPACPAPTSSGR